MSFILHNANIFTSNRKAPRASALAIVNDRIVAVGKDSEIKAIKLKGAKQINMRGAFVMPGLIDAHVHLMSTGYWRQRVNLFEVPSPEEAMSRVKARAAKTQTGTWVRGSGWLQAVWQTDRLPTVQDIDGATTTHPVCLTAKSGHAIWVNSVALRLCGIDKDTRDPEGGLIERDAQGKPSGVLHETAMRLITDHIPEPTQADQENVTADVMRAMNKLGLTSVHCMDGKGGIDSFNAYERVLASGRATLRVVKNLPAEDLDAVIAAGLRSGFGGPMLKVGGIKFFKDGALGPRSALMIEPYSDEPGNRGISVYDQKKLVHDFARAHAAGLATVTHAIGDQANRDVLDAIEASRKSNQHSSNSKKGNSPDLRDRIEHSQHVHVDDLKRWAALGVIASVQPIHATQDFQMAFPRIGEERCRSSYAFATLKKLGARLAFGTDSPVESFDPFACIYAAVTRRHHSGLPGPKGFFPSERIGIAETLRHYTIDAAYAGYQDHETGSLEAGKLADLIVLDRDLTAVDAEQIPTTKVKQVMLGGDWIV